MEERVGFESDGLRLAGILHLPETPQAESRAAFLVLRDRRRRGATRDTAPPQGVLVHPHPRERHAAESPPRPPAAAPPDRTQAEVDRLLDKISASGIESLTPAERRFLAETSRRLRDRD